jgi:hypothetical protein
MPLLTLSAFDIANENTERNKISDCIFLMTCFCRQLKITIEYLPRLRRVCMRAAGQVKCSD